MQTHQKIVVSGQRLEHFTYAVPIEYDISVIRGPRLPFSIDDEIYDGREEKGRDSSIYRTRRTVKELLAANAWQYFERPGVICRPKFFTATFAENLTDIDAANWYFELFIKRLNYHVFGTKKNLVRYLAVPEYQKRGAVHYHVVFFNVPYSQASWLEKIWSHGDIEISAIDNLDQLHLYIAKYITKDFIPGKNRRRYLASKSLKRPIEIRDEQQVREIMQHIPKESLKYEKFYSAKFVKRVDYQIYDFGEGYNVLSEIPIFDQILTPEQTQKLATS